MVAPATRSSVGCPDVDLSPSNYECGTINRKHETESSTCTKASRVKPTQAEPTATLTLASCVLLLLLPLLAAGEALL